MARIEPKSKSDRKYLIEAVLADKLDRDITQTKFLEYISHHHIKKATFYTDKAIKIDSPSSISEFRLQVYAKALGVSMQELINYEVNQRPVNQVHADAKSINRRESIIKSNNLSQ